MNRVALLTECRPYEPHRTPEEHLQSVGGNTGNNAYITALIDIFGAERVSYHELDKSLVEDQYDIYLVGNLSWIVENTPVQPYAYEGFRKIVSKGKRFVPISVGTQTSLYKSDFTYHPVTLRMLREISEQAVIACRGYYTAELLRKNGVSQVEVIGCPSLYHRKDPDFKILKKRELPTHDYKIASGLTPWPTRRMDIEKIQYFFKFIMKNKVEYVEQTNTRWMDSLFKYDSTMEEELMEYWHQYSKIFYNIDEWRQYARGLDFSFGGRFHGNVIPLLEGIPALFMTIDARTQEMTDYFRLPTLNIEDFNEGMSLKELYEYADYTEFN